MIYLFYVSVLVIIGLLFYSDWSAIQQRGLNEVGREVWPALVVVIIFALLQELAIQRRVKKEQRHLEALIVGVPEIVSRDVARRILESERFELVVKSVVGDRIIGEPLAGSFADALRRILAESRFICELQLQFEITRDPTGDGVLLKINETFSAGSAEERFVVAVTAESALFKRLANYASQVDKVYAPWDCDANTVAEDIFDRIQLVVHYTHREPVRAKTVLASPAEKHDLLSDVALTADERDRIAVAVFNYDPVDDGATVSLSFTVPMPLEEGYFFWSVDRNAFVRSVVIDYRDVVKEIANVFIVEFCASPGLRVSHERARGVYRADCEGWFLVGHGIMMKWSSQAVQGE